MSFALKDKLLTAMASAYTQEFDELLGAGRGQKRKCWNTAAHDDKSPSLTFNPKHGGWKCHACGESGDIFTLYMKVRNLTFPQVMELLLRKYNLWQEVREFVSVKPTKKGRSGKGGYSEVTQTDVLESIGPSCAALVGHEQYMTLLTERYGLTRDTVLRWKLGVKTYTHRLQIPIWTFRSIPSDGEAIASLVNVRYHDTFRTACSWSKGSALFRKRPSDVTWKDIINQEFHGWTPVWSERAGKVSHLAGHGCAYVYPFEVLIDNPEVYVVGGELKALLLNQLGLPAVTFTSGEGGYNDDMLPYFMGKRVWIIMDADPDAKVNSEGLRPADVSARRLGLALANAGAEVRVAEWPDEIRGYLPQHGGDVTDFLRLAGWDPQAIKLLPWVAVERRPDATSESDNATNATSAEMEKVFENAPLRPFSSLSEPGQYNQWIKVNALVAGRGQTPHAVPDEVTFNCRAGETDRKPICAGCSLPHQGFNLSYRLTVEEQLDCLGTPISRAGKSLKRYAGVAENCTYPKWAVKPAAVDTVLLSPPIEQLGDDDEHNSSLFTYQRVFLLDPANDGRAVLEDNAEYQILGKVTSDPKSGLFTMAGIEWRPISSSALQYRHSVRGDAALRTATYHGKPVAEQVEMMVADLRDNVVRQIYGADSMLATIWLTWFMPFQFELERQLMNRICPAIMVLGDTTTGKSTTAHAITRHYRVGRFITCDNNTTYAGLVGGNLKTSSGGPMDFTWGILPASHRSFVALDEYNKLDERVIGGLTGAISSGIASRNTVTGARSAPCHVRLLYLANPRGTKRLTAYQNPIDAAREVVGTVQDLGRIDMIHIQYSGGMKAPPKNVVEHLYDRKMARYHIQWAWSRGPKSYKFQDTADIRRRGEDLAHRYSDHVLLLREMAHMKLARIAAAFATMTFSMHGDDVIVTPEHVAYAEQFVRNRYDPYLLPSNPRANDTIQYDLVQVMDQVQRWQRLYLLHSAVEWTDDDLMMVFGGNTQQAAFLDAAYFKLGLLVRKGRMWAPRDLNLWRTMIQEYILFRQRAGVEGDL